jgi:hypothetical protein
LRALTPHPHSQYYKRVRYLKTKGNKTPMDVATMVEIGIGIAVVVWGTFFAG